VGRASGLPELLSGQARGPPHVLAQLAKRLIDRRLPLAVGFFAG